MDNNYCCVPQCSSHGCNLPRPSFHRFPSPRENKGIRRLQWIAKLRIGKEVTPRMVVCGKHFKPFDFFPATAGSHGLKRQRLKKNAVPSLYLPISCEDIVKKEDGVNSWKINKAKPSNKTPLIKRKKTPVKNSSEEQNLSFVEETNSNESIRNQEEVNSKTASNSKFGIKEEITDTSPCITQLRIIVPNYSAIDANTIERNSKNVEKYIQNCKVSLLPVNMNENSKLDYSVFKSSPDDSKETLANKLDTMVSVNELLQKKASFFQNKCKMYETEVNIMKGVINNLKQINSATFDN